MKRPATIYLVNSLKWLVPTVILSWLLWKHADAIGRLFTQPKDLKLLGLSLLTLLTATCLSFVRWFLLVRALEIPFTVGRAIRLGFLGYLFNFVGIGSFGGDLFKAYFLARDQKERRSEAVATIFLDRLVGMFSLFCVATFAIIFMGADEIPKLGDFLRLVTWLTFAGAAGIVLLLLPSHFSDWLLLPIEKLRWVGGIATRVRNAIELYRKRRSWLLLIGLMGIVIHILVGVTIHFADRSVHTTVPDLTEHMIISPLASVASAAPVPGGFGTYELAMDVLFEMLPNRTMEPGQGIRVAVMYRLLTVVIAAIGLFYYALNRSAVAEAVSVIESKRKDSEN